LQLVAQKARERVEHEQAQLELQQRSRHGSANGYWLGADLTNLAPGQPLSPEQACRSSLSPFFRGRLRRWPGCCSRWWGS
jgi:hypothetical protein